MRVLVIRLGELVVRFMAPGQCNTGARLEPMRSALTGLVVVSSATAGDCGCGVECHARRSYPMRRRPLGTMSQVNGAHGMGVVFAWSRVMRNVVLVFVMTAACTSSAVAQNPTTTHRHQVAPKPIKVKASPSPRPKPWYCTPYGSAVMYMEREVRGRRNAAPSRVLELYMSGRWELSLPGKPLRSGCVPMAEVDNLRNAIKQADFTPPKPTKGEKKCSALTLVWRSYYDNLTRRAATEGVMCGGRVNPQVLALSRRIWRLIPAASKTSPKLTPETRRARGCQRDSDCVLVSHILPECCPGCSNRIPVNRRYAKTIASVCARRRRHITRACVPPPCAPPGLQPKPVCDQGLCVARWPK